MERGLLPIGSVWFPTRNELEAWKNTPLPLYVRWRGPLAFEIGPRTASMRSACFCPVLRGTLLPVDGGCHLDWVVSTNRFTTVLLGSWMVVAVLWAIWLVPQLMSGDAHPSWLLWWAIPVVGAATAWLVGRYQGTASLLAGADHLRTTAATPVPEPPTEEEPEETEDSLSDPE